MKVFSRLAAAFLMFFVFAFANTPVAWSAPKTNLREISVGGKIEKTYRQVALPILTTHVAVEWSGDAKATIHLKWRNGDGNTITAHLGNDADANLPNDRHQSSVYPVGDTREVSVRTLDSNVHELTVIAIDVVHGTRTPYFAIGDLVETANAGDYPAPSIVKRAGWGADESLRRNSPHFATVNRFAIHHTDTSNNDPNPEATMRAIYAFHVLGRGWDDIGYNYLIDRNGVIYEGRYSRNYASGTPPTADNSEGEGVIGAHLGNWNSGSVGISLMGNFQVGNPSGAQLTSLEKLIAWQSDRHNLVPGGNVTYTSGVTGQTVKSTNIIGHRDLGQTSCPGNNLYSRLSDIRAGARSRWMSKNPSTDGYRIATKGGAVVSLGSARYSGDMRGTTIPNPIISMASTPRGFGYWLQDSAGRILSFGNAKHYGSVASKPGKAVVGMTATRSGLGYRVVTSSGGVYEFGAAKNYGDRGGHPNKAPIVGMAMTPSGHGYWLVGEAGKVFAFGDAQTFAPVGAIPSGDIIVGMTSTPSGGGYWLLAANGKTFAYGDAKNLGGLPDLRLLNYSKSVAIKSSETGDGFWISRQDGRVYTFGDAVDYGNAAGRSARAFSVS